LLGCRVAGLSGWSLLEFAKFEEDDRAAEEESEDREDPDDAGDAFELRLEQDELTVRELEVLEDLFLGVSPLEELPDLTLHVDGHLGRRVGDGHALADRATQEGGDLVGALVELLAGDGRALRRTDELRGVGDLEAEEEDEKDHCRIAFWRFSWRMSDDIGPEYFARITPLPSRK
jgi:hypothetical protein